MQEVSKKIYTQVSKLSTCNATVSHVNLQDDKVLAEAFRSASSSLCACNKGCGISGFNPHFKGITNVKSQKK
jgi:hypothetical protein